MLLETMDIAPYPQSLRFIEARGIATRKTGLSVSLGMPGTASSFRSEHSTCLRSRAWRDVYSVDRFDVRMMQAVPPKMVEVMSEGRHELASLRTTGLIELHDSVNLCRYRTHWQRIYVGTLCNLRVEPLAAWRVANMSTQTLCARIVAYCSLIIHA